MWSLERIVSRSRFCKRLALNVRDRYGEKTDSQLEAINTLGDLFQVYTRNQALFGTCGK